MKKETIVANTKNIIMHELFSDINGQNCTIDICLQDANEFEKIKKSISQVSIVFFDVYKYRLDIAYKNNNDISIRKSNYEKILDEYLCTIYDLNKLENLEDEIDDEIDCNKRRDREIQEVQMFVNIANLQWTKIIGTKSIIYMSNYNNRKVSLHINRMQNTKKNSPKKDNITTNFCFKYAEKQLQYIDFNLKEVIVTIEKTHPQILKNDNIIYITNDKNFVDPKILKRQQKRKEEIRIREEKNRKLKEDNNKRHEILKEQKKLERIEKKKQIRQMKKKEEREKIQQLPQISIQDFIVRTNVFKCMHSNHNVIDLDAAVKVIGENDKEHLEKISAGYCEQCNIYFIMESTYIKLRSKGIVLCRICDEKTYMKGSYLNGMRLAQESILMQFGYTVSQEEGLSATQRQKILAVIIDNKILSKSEIISYLDFFINQRQYQSKFELAISKWETDREFVQEYRIGQYTQFGVNAIYRR